MAAAVRLALSVRTLPLIAVIVVPAGIPVPLMAVPTTKLVELVSVRLLEPLAPAVEVEEGAAKRLPWRTRAPAPTLVRPPVMLPLAGLRVRTPVALETSIVPVAMLSGRAEEPVAPVKRRVPAFSVMPVVVPRPRELPTVSAMVLASRTPSLMMVAPV